MLAAEAAEAAEVAEVVEAAEAAEAAQAAGMAEVAAGIDDVEVPMAHGTRKSNSTLTLAMAAWSSSLPASLQMEAVEGLPRLGTAPAPGHLMRAACMVVEAWLAD